MDGLDRYINDILSYIPCTYEFNIQADKTELFIPGMIFLFFNYSAFYSI